MNHNIDIDAIWSIFDEQTSGRNTNKNTNEKKSIDEKGNANMIQNQLYCSQCDVLIQEAMCNNCGLVVCNNQEFSNYSYEEPIQIKSYPNSNSNSRIVKIQEWMMWSNDEKNEYKLNKYIKELCDKLNVHESLLNSIYNLVSQVMSAIKKSCDGPKRSKVKDGIIIICIYYVSKSTSTTYSYMQLAKKINLNMKYISKADKLIMELISSNKLQLSQEFMQHFYKTENPIDYVKTIIDKYQLSIHKNIIQQVEELVHICEDNDILLDHTPISIGVSCFYYILNINNIEINVKMFSELYDLSMVTILKTFNKLKQYTQEFEKMGISKIT